MKDFKGQTTSVQNARLSDGQEKFKGGWTVYFGLCKSCYMCIEKCPFGAIAVDSEKLGVYSTPAVKVDSSKCTLCKICEQICPDCALLVEKESESK